MVGSRYILSNFLLIIVVAVQSRMLSQLSGDGEKTGLFDRVTSSVLGFCWLGLHVRFLYMGMQNYLHGGKKRDRALST